jgi:hypothetical protein
MITKYTPYNSFHKWWINNFCLKVNNTPLICFPRDEFISRREENHHSNIWESIGRFLSHQDILNISYSCKSLRGSIKKFYKLKPPPGVWDWTSWIYISKYLDHNDLVHLAMGSRWMHQFVLDIYDLGQVPLHRCKHHLVECFHKNMIDVLVFARITNWLYYSHGTAGLVYST